MEVEALRENATAADAEVIRKMYDSHELNRRHAATVRVVDVDLCGALIEFRDRVIPQPVSGRKRSSDTVRRYTNCADNLIGYFRANKIKKFSDVGEEVVEGLFNYMTSTLNRSASTLELQRQVLTNFF